MARLEWLAPLGWGDFSCRLRLVMLLVQGLPKVRGNLFTRTYTYAHVCVCVRVCGDLKRGLRKGRCWSLLLHHRQHLAPLPVSTCTHNCMHSTPCEKQTKERAEKQSFPTRTHSPLDSPRASRECVSECQTSTTRLTYLAGVAQGRHAHVDPHVCMLAVTASRGAVVPAHAPLASLPLVDNETPCLSFFPSRLPHCLQRQTACWLSASPLPSLSLCC